MKIFIKQVCQRFKSQVPPIVKKIQMIVGSATVMFAGGAAIEWPNNMADMTAVCKTGAAVCMSIPIILQFLQQSATALETKTELTITQTATSNDVSVDEVQK